MRTYVDQDGTVLRNTEATRLIIDNFLQLWIHLEYAHEIVAPLGRDCEKQIKTWLWGYDLPADELFEAVHVTFMREPDDLYRYFCGVVWNKVRTAASRGFDQR